MPVSKPTALDLLSDDLRGLLVPLLQPAPVLQGRSEEWKAERRIAEQQSRELAARVVTAPDSTRDIVTNAVCRQWFDTPPTPTDRFWLVAILRAGLAEQVILPTLLERLARPRVPELRWLYQVCAAIGADLSRVMPGREGEDTYAAVLREALALDPDEVATWRLLVDLLLDRVAYGTHEWNLGQGPADGSAHEYLATAREAERAIKNAPLGAVPAAYAEDIRAEIDKLTSWIEYKAAEPSMSFFDWLRLRSA